MGNAIYRNFYSQRFAVSFNARLYFYLIGFCLLELNELTGLKSDAIFVVRYLNLLCFFISYHYLINGCQFEINMILKPKMANVSESGDRPWADTGLAPEVCGVGNTNIERLGLQTSPPHIHA